MRDEWKRRINPFFKKSNVENDLEIKENDWFSWQPNTSNFAWKVGAQEGGKKGCRFLCPNLEAFWFKRKWALDTMAKKRSSKKIGPIQDLSYPNLNRS